MKPVRLFICLTPTGAHLAYERDETALCRASVRGAVSHVLEPGSDFGEVRGDCAKCDIARREAVRR